MLSLCVNYWVWFCIKTQSRTMDVLCLSGLIFLEKKTGCGLELYEFHIEPWGAAEMVVWKTPVCFIFLADIFPCSWCIACRKKGGWAKMHHTAVGWGCSRVGQWNTHQEQNGRSDGWEWFLRDEHQRLPRGCLFCGTQKLPNTTITLLYNI